MIHPVCPEQSCSFGHPVCLVFGTPCMSGLFGHPVFLVYWDTLYVWLADQLDSEQSALSPDDNVYYYLAQCILYTQFLWDQGFKSVYCVCQNVRQIDRQIDIRQIDRQTYRQIDIQIDRQIVCLKRFDRRKEIHEQRIEYILEGKLLEKSVKRPICCTVSILQVYFSYLCYITFWALEHHFIENLKLMLKENQIMKQDGFIIDQ